MGDMRFVDELEQAIREVAQRVAPSVVQVRGGRRGGSGFVIEPGFVLTNAHNVVRGEMALQFADGRRADGRIAGIDVDGDLAVVAAATGDAPALEWEHERPAGVGSAVFGVAASGSDARVTMGFVSSVERAFRGPRGRRISGSIEHTAPLAAGSSGSPLVNAGGRLVAVNTNRLGGGFYLALPADQALADRVAALRRGETVERPRLGVGLAPPEDARRLRHAVGLPERDGLLVRDVEDESPARRAGVEVGDLIVGADDRAITDADDLYDALGAAPGASLTLRVVRGVEERMVQVQFNAAGAEGSGPLH